MASKRKTVTRMKLEETMKIKIIGEHNRRKNSRYGKQHELLRKCATVAAFYKRGGQREVLRAAVLDKFARVVS